MGKSLCPKGVPPELCAGIRAKRNSANVGIPELLHPTSAIDAVFDSPSEDEDNNVTGGNSLLDDGLFNAVKKAITDEDGDNTSHKSLLHGGLLDVITKATTGEDVGGQSNFYNRMHRNNTGDGYGRGGGSVAPHQRSVDNWYDQFDPRGLDESARDRAKASKSRRSSSSGSKS